MDWTCDVSALQKLLSGGNPILVLQVDEIGKVSGKDVRSLLRFKLRS
jgi:hypothetical protein